MTEPRSVTVVVPTMGGSPVLGECLDALAASAGVETRVVLVADERVDTTTLPGRSSVSLLMAPADSGFAVSCNLGLATVETPYAAIVNDDAIVDPAWLIHMVNALESDPSAGAVQGLNRQLHRPSQIDGCGISWNRRWQPIQIDHGRERPSMTDTTQIFGVSATAALYRSPSLDQAAVGPASVFAPELHTYYDDVDLAGRLTAAGWRSLFVPAGEALHAGGATTDAVPVWRSTQLYGNRLLVLARLLGRQYWPRLPFILRTDLIDLARGDRARRRGILAGWRRAIGALARFAHLGPPLVPIASLRPRRSDQATVR